MLDPMDDPTKAHMLHKLRTYVTLLFNSNPRSGESNIYRLSLTVKEIRDEANDDMLLTLCDHLLKSSTQDLMELCIAPESAPTTNKLIVSKVFMKDIDSHCRKAMTTDIEYNDVDDIALCTWSNGLNQYNTITAVKTLQVRVAIIFMRAKVTLFHMFKAISHGYNLANVAIFIKKLHFAITTHLENAVADQYAPTLRMNGGLTALIPDAAGLYDFNMF